MLGETWEQRAALYEVLAMRDNHQVHLQRSFCANHSFTPTVDSGTVIAGIHDNNGEGDGRK